MNTNQQLELGPIEKVQPDVTMEQAKPSPFDDTEMPEFGLFGSEVPKFGLNNKPEAVFPPTEAQLEEAANLYNMAGGGIGLAPVTPMSVLDAMKPDIGNAEIGVFLDELRNEDSEIQKQLILDTIGNPRLAVDAKMELMREYEALENGAKFDVNIVSRNAMYNVASELPADSEEEQELREMAFEEADAMPTTIVSETAGYTPEQLQEAFSFFLNAAAMQANEGATLLKPAGTALGVEGKVPDWLPGEVNTDFLATMIPFRFNVPIMNIYEEAGLAYDAVNTGASAILPGEALKQLREKAESGTIEEKTDLLRIVLKHVGENTGLLGDGNDFVAAHILNEIFYKDLTGNDYYEDSVQPLKNSEGKGILSATQFFDNLGGLLDATIIYPILKGTVKLGSRFLPKNYAALNKIAPKTAAEMAQQILDNPALAERLGGISPAQWAENILPSHRTFLGDGGIDGLMEIAARQAQLRDEIVSLSNRTSLSMKERADAADEIVMMFRTANNAQPYAAHNAKHGMIPEEGGVRIQAVFGRDETSPFTSYNKAVEAAQKAFPDSPLKILQEVGGKLQPVTGPVKGRGKFFFEAEDFRPYASAENTVGRLVLGGDDVSTGMFSGLFNGKLAGFVKNTGSLFSPRVNDAMSVAARTRHKWLSLSEQLTKSVDSLSAPDKAILNSLLKEGEKAKTSTGRGKIFTVNELRARGLGAQTIKAYYEYRGASDILFQVTNQQVRTAKLANGVKDITFKNGSVGHAKPLGQADALKDIRSDMGATTLPVYDPVKNAYVRMSPLEIETMYKQGNSLARLDTPMLGKGADEATHVLVDAKAGVGIRELPKQVINKIEGHYPHMWDGNFIVYGVTKGGNRVALGVARSAADAKAAVQRVVASGKGKKFDKVDFDFDRSLRDPAYRAKMVDDMYLNMGGPIYGKRSGGMLKNYSPDSGDAMVDPVEAIVRGMELVSMNVTKNTLVDHMQTKLRNFMTMEGLSVKGATDFRTMPVRGSDITGPASKAAELRKAQVYAEQINMFARTPDAVDIATSAVLKNLSVGIDDLFSRGPKWLQKAGKKLSGPIADRASKGFEPFSFLNTLAHKTVIATAPFTHLALQSMQSMVMLGIAPRGYLPALRQMTGLTALTGLKAMERGGTIALMSAKEWDEAYTAAAKVMGIPKAELKQLVEVFDGSGLINAVSHNSIIRQNLRSSGEAYRLSKARAGTSVRDQAGRALRQADAATFGAMGKVGFEAGENINQMLTFLSFYNADRKAGKALLSSPEYVQSLVGRTAEISGNMIPELGFKYQRGFLKTAMQFVSFQHKMLALMTPQMLGGSKAITGWQKAGLALTQFAMYGKKGVPHVDAFFRLVEDRINNVDLPADEKQKLLEDYAKLRPVLDGFLVDKGVNYVLKELYGEETPEFDLSGRFAPGGGTEFMVDRLLKLSSLDIGEFFGIGGQKFSKLADWMETASYMTLAQARGMDKVPLDERAEELVKSGGALLFSQYNKYLAVEAAKKMGGWVTAGGNITQGYESELEGALFSLFGVTTKDRQQLYNAMEKYEARTVTDTDFKEVQLQELANSYYQKLIFRSIQVQEHTASEEHYDNLMLMWVREQNLLFSMLGEDDAERVSQLVEERISEALVSNDSAEKRFVEKLTDKLRNNAFGGDGPEISSYLMQQDFTKNPELIMLVNDAFRHAHDETETE